MDLWYGRLEPGYWELKLDWTDEDLMKMSPVTYGYFKELITSLETLIKDGKSEGIEADIVIFGQSERSEGTARKDR